VIGVTLLWAFLASPLITSTHFAQTKESNRAQENRLLESTSEKIRPGQRMEGANLENEDLHLSMLAGVRLKRAKLKSANLEMAMLVGADLQGADLEYANLKQAMLVGANLGKAKLINTNFEEANLLGASLEGARIEGQVSRIHTLPKIRSMRPVADRGRCLEGLKFRSRVRRPQSLRCAGR